jgi:hypothetical protein
MMVTMLVVRVAFGGSNLSLCKKEEVGFRKPYFDGIVTYSGGSQSSPVVSVTASSKTIHTSNRYVEDFGKPMTKKTQYCTVLVPEGGSSKAIIDDCPNKDDNKLDPKKTPR